MDETIEKHWTVQNTNTLLKWITIGSYYIKVLERNIAVNRAIIRYNTIQSIILTTATGSIGVSQISSIFPAQTQMVLTLIFTVMSFFLTISTGVIKVLLIHENLEKCIQVKQEWTSFITNISTELQLPRGERQDAVKLIRDNKMVYLSLLNKDIEINYKSEEKAKNDIQDEINISKLELQTDAASISIRKKGINDDIIEFEYSKKKTLHNDYSRMMNSVGISISDITNHIVKTELQAIVELDLEAQREQVHIKSAQMDKVKLNCELQFRQKTIDNKKIEKSQDVLLLTNRTSSDIANDNRGVNSLTLSTMSSGSGSGSGFGPLQSMSETNPEQNSDTKSETIPETNTETNGTWRNLFNL